MFIFEGFGVRIGAEGTAVIAAGVVIEGISTGVKVGTGVSTFVSMVAFTVVGVTVAAGVANALTRIFVEVGKSLGVAILVRLASIIVGEDVGVTLANSDCGLASTVASTSGMGCWPQAITSKPKTR